MKEKMHKKKTIALIAHDNKKDELLEWAKENIKTLKKHNLCGTGTTSALISSRLNLNVKEFLSGPYGGDLQVGSKIAEGLIDIVIFFYDPLTMQPHDPDIKALMRVATLYDIPIAINRSTADFILSSDYMEEEFEKNSVDINSMMKKRKAEFKNLK